MRQVVLDTETTGVSVEAGNRVIEIGCVELVGRRPSGRSFHRYVNPERDSEPGALRVHGLSTGFLSDKPLFAEVADDFLEFIRGAELVIHNAPFDVGFLDAELERCCRNYGRLADHAVGILDTYEMARELYPGQRASLDALCKRFEVDNSGRALHGALLDAGLLADVYLAMTSGQFDLNLELAQEQAQISLETGVSAASRQLHVVCADAAELAAHAARLDTITRVAGHCLWPRSVPGDAE